MEDSIKIAINNENIEEVTQNIENKTILLEAKYEKRLMESYYMQRLKILDSIKKSKYFSNIEVK